MIGFIAGLFTGGALTVVLFSMLVAASDEDDREGRG